jgi:cytochrome c oxidase subunit 4
MTTHDSSTCHAGVHEAAPGALHPHVTTMRLLLSVFGALVLLTIVTVGVTWFDMGDFNIWVALGIAVLKASLVVLYFMHLRWESPFNAIAFIAGLTFVAIFLAMVMGDSSSYQHNLHPPGDNIVQTP